MKRTPNARASLAASGYRGTAELFPNPAEPNLVARLTGQVDRSPDADPLAYYWDFSDRTFGSNTTVVTKSWSSAGYYTVRCVASDMKGGTASRWVVVTVGPEDEAILGLAGSPRPG